MNSTDVKKIVQKQLQKMEKNGLLVKTKDGYSITLKGHSKLAEGETKQ